MPHASGDRKGGDASAQQSAQIGPRECAPAARRDRSRSLRQNADVKRYKEGGPNSFRLGHGQWRAIYRIDREAQEMQVQIIDTRGSVYR